MKIGIVTLFGDNYGNKLQNYALQELLKKELDSEVETILVNEGLNYYHKLSFFERVYKLRPSNIVRFVKTKISAKKDQSAPCEVLAAKRDAFVSFVERHLSIAPFSIDARFDDSDSRLETFDYFITGSDQVWNRTKAPYFLRFAPEEKRCSFAASFGVSQLPRYLKHDYTKWINEIPLLSVREDQGAKIVKELTGRKAEVLLDPTMGLTAEQWETIERKPLFVSDRPYILTYFLGDRIARNDSFTEQLAKEKGWDVLRLNDDRDLVTFATGPSEFLYLIHHAQIVLTDSFHGSVFSILYKRPFVVFDRMENGYVTQGTRIDTLLRQTGLISRKEKAVNNQTLFNIDFSEADKALDEGRRRQRAFLSRISIPTRQPASIKPSLATKHLCTGCGVCANACSVNAISMIRDKEGFSYPSVDASLCVNCHACERVCPIGKEQQLSADTKAYYAFSKDAECCAASSSGGVFSELAKAVLANRGIVCGAAFDENFQVRHVCISDISELGSLRTSKYVQSETGYIYKEVRDYLKSGRQVLFSGTPCQVVALKMFLGKEYANLFVVDIICHGVPSPGLWSRYLNERHSEQPIKSISFRDKTIGWNEFSMKIVYANGKVYRKLATKDPFEKAFLANITLRPSCYNCQFKTVGRCSDITLADYWGMELVHPELKKQQGVSLVLAHSAVGENMIGGISESLVIGETELSRATGMNSACTKSVACPEKRSQAFNLLERCNFQESVNKVLRPSLLERVKRVAVFFGVRIKRAGRLLKNWIRSKK